MVVPQGMGIKTAFLVKVFAGKRRTSEAPRVGNSLDLTSYFVIPSSQGLSTNLSGPTKYSPYARICVDPFRSPCDMNGSSVPLIYCMKYLLDKEWRKSENN